MTDFQAQIPQQIEHRFDDLFGPRRLFPRCQKRNIDIRKGGHFGPAITADGNQRQPFGRRRVPDRIQPQRHEIEREAQDLIDQERLRGGRVAPALGMFSQAASDFGATRIEHGFEACCRRLSQVFGIEQGQRISERAPVDNGAPVGDSVEAISHATSALRSGAVDDKREIMR